MEKLYFCAVKVLIVRFSSIGDVVLTTPVVRAVREQLNAEVHFLTKKNFETVVAPNPNITKVYAIQKSIDEVLEVLKEEAYDWIIDLHNNVRTKALKSKLRRPSKTFRKLNIEKWLLVRFKINRMPDLHVVDRYFETVAHLGVIPDGKPGDFYVEESNRVDLATLGLEPKAYVTIAIGAQHATKRLPVSKLVELITAIDLPVVLVGGVTDIAAATEITEQVGTKAINTCGKLNLQQSASVVQQSQHLITHDTGMMHIASCFRLPMSTVWGNTVPSFGMTPYIPNANCFSIHEVKGLSCRPCSKIGHDKCPKGHFKCMMEQDVQSIANTL